MSSLNNMPKYNSNRYIYSNSNNKKNINSLTNINDY